jgi:hypothetical protein
MKGLRYFEMSGTTSPPTQPHFPEDLNPQDFIGGVMVFVTQLEIFQCHAVFSTLACSSCYHQ